MSTILKVDDINVYYGSIHAIKGISFEVNEGEIVTLIGANGAGKSTTLNTIACLLRSKTGGIEFMGESLNHVPSHKVVSKGLALVPEGRRVFLQMTVQENLDMGAFSRKGGNISADMERVFEQFPRLKERRKQVAGTLSGGEQQMLAMGRALMSNPKLLMLDEPSMGLAPILVEQIFDIIKEHSAGGTERTGGPQRGQPRLCSGNRQDRHHRHRRGATGLSRHQEGISRRLMPLRPSVHGSGSTFLITKNMRWKTPSAYFFCYILPLSAQVFWDFMAQETRAGKLV